MTRDELFGIIAKGILAPSGDNLQPWKFFIEENAINLYLDRSHEVLFWDTALGAPYVSTGAVIENIRIAAEHLGYQAKGEYFPDHKNNLWVARIAFEQSSSSSSGNHPGHPPGNPLYNALEKRCTNRKFYNPGRAIDDSIFKDFDESPATISGVRLLWIKKKEPSYKLLSELIGKVDQFRFEHQIISYELIKAIRFSKEEIRKTKDGLDIATLEVGPTSDLFFKFISAWPRLKFLNYLGNSRLLGFYGKAQMGSSQAAGLVVSDGQKPVDYVKSGELVQRVWLKATSHGLSLQPMTGLPITILNLSLGPQFFSPSQRAAMEHIRDKFFSLFSVNQQNGMIFLFRIGYSQNPSARSLRRPLDSFILKEKP